MIENKTILCDSNIPWHHNRYSKHHIMSRLARKNRVIFVNPQVDYFEFLKTKKYNPFSILNRTERPKDELLDVFTPLAVPFKDKFDFVHKIDPWYFTRQIKRVLKDIDRRNLILFLGNPWNVFLLDYFGDCACTIYHCSDNFSALFVDTFGEKVLRREEEMIRRVGLVVAVSEALYEKCKKLNPLSFLVQHGVDEKYFSQRNEDVNIPDDMKNIPGPRIGFVGRLDDGIDYELLSYAIAKHRDKSFVFLGKSYPSVQAGVKSLINHKNSYYLGNKSWRDIPTFVRKFDIGLIPYVRNEFNLHRTTPLKLIEYLAGDNPVVSTVESAPIFKDVVFVADNKEEFVNQIERAISLSRDNKHNGRIRSLVKDWSWDKKVEEVSTLLKECITSRGYAGNFSL